MRTFLRRFLAALTHSGPSYEHQPLPARGDAVEAWLRAHRDREQDRYGRSPEWYALDRALGDYRLHAEIGTPLGEHACDHAGCDCAGVTS